MKKTAPAPTRLFASHQRPHAVALGLRFAFLFSAFIAAGALLALSLAPFVV